MKKLANIDCVPCRGGVPALPGDEIADLLPQIPDWNLIEKNGIKRLMRQYKFGNFAQALAFANQIGEMAEQEDHHPALLVEWGNVTVTWWTHVIRGLHLNDFILAARTNDLYQSNKL